MPALRHAQRKASTGIPDTNPIERLNKEVKRRADVVGIFPNEGDLAPPTILQLFSGKRWCDVILCMHGMAKVFGLAC